MADVKGSADQEAQERLQKFVRTTSPEKQAEVRARLGRFTHKGPKLVKVTYYETGGRAAPPAEKVTIQPASYQPSHVIIPEKEKKVGLQLEKSGEVRYVKPIEKKITPYRVKEEVPTHYRIDVSHLHKKGVPVDKTIELARGKVRIQHEPYKEPEYKPEFTKKEYLKRIVSPERKVRETTRRQTEYYVKKGFEKTHSGFERVIKLEAEKEVIKEQFVDLAAKHPVTKALTAKERARLKTTKILGSADPYFRVKGRQTEAFGKFSKEELFYGVEATAFGLTKTVVEAPGKPFKTVTSIGKSVVYAPIEFAKHPARFVGGAFFTGWAIKGISRSLSKGEPVGYDVDVKYGDLTKISTNIGKKLTGTVKVTTTSGVIKGKLRFTEKVRYGFETVKQAAKEVWTGEELGVAPLVRAKLSKPDIRVATFKAKGKDFKVTAMTKEVKERFYSPEKVKVPEIAGIRRITRESILAKKGETGVFRRTDTKYTELFAEKGKPIVITTKGPEIKYMFEAKIGQISGMVTKPKKDFLKAYTEKFTGYVKKPKFKVKKYKADKPGPTDFEYLRTDAKTTPKATDTIRGAQPVNLQPVKVATERVPHKFYIEPEFGPMPQRVAFVTAERVTPDMQYMQTFKVTAQKPVFKGDSPRLGFFAAEDLQSGIKDTIILQPKVRVKPKTVQFQQPKFKAAEKQISRQVREVKIKPKLKPKFKVKTVPQVVPAVSFVPSLKMEVTPKMEQVIVPEVITTQRTFFDERPPPPPNGGWWYPPSDKKKRKKRKKKRMFDVFGYKEVTREVGALWPL